MKFLKLFKVSRGESLDRIYLLKLFGCGVFLHRIHGSDPPNLYHNHPWPGLSIIFGNYTEFFRPELILTPEGTDQYHAHDPEWVYPQYKRWFWNWIDAKRHHRVVVKRPTWTLFIHGRKCNQWEIVNAQGLRVEKPWEGHEGTKSYSNAAKAA